MNKLSRRDFTLSTLTAATAVFSHPCQAQDQAAANAGESQSADRFQDVGLIIYSWEVGDRDWPKVAKELGFHTLSLHAARRLDVLVRFVQSKAGRAFLDRCEQFGIAVEYELHAMSDLLSRELFYKDASLFRLDQQGKRNPDLNCCPSSAAALEIVASRAVEFGRILRPTTGRYFYWTDDAGKWCQCDQCRELSPSDQATAIENAIVSALQSELDPDASLAHLAYHSTFNPPKNVKPHSSLFLEAAPSRRSYDVPISDAKTALTTREPRPEFNSGYLDMIRANQAVFGRDSSQILEYWLDASYFSRWRRPVKKLPWTTETLRQDLQAYRDLGGKHLRTFALWLGPRYEDAYGPSALSAFSDILRER